MRPPLDWASALTDDLVHVHVQGRVSANRTQSTMSSAVERLDALVDRLRLLLVALEADERELGTAGQARREIR
jgi:hypothetical protein